MNQNYNHFANLRKPGRFPDGSMFTARSADIPLFALKLAGIESYHGTRTEAVKHYEARGYRVCSDNESFATPLDELKYNLRERVIL